MAAQLIFYNMSLVLFASCFQYAILGAYNLARMDMYQTAIDYFILRFQIFVYGSAYVLSICLLCLQKSESDKGSESKGDLIKGQFSVDLISLCTISAISVLALVGDSILSCYTTSNKGFCVNTWDGNYRLAFAFFYFLIGMTILGSLQIVRTKTRSALYADGARRKTYIFVFYCLYIAFITNFFQKFEEECGHKNRQSSLPVTSLVIMTLVLNMILEILHYNDYDRNMSGAVFQFSVHGQYLLHLALYATVFITYDGILNDYILLAVTVFVFLFEMLGFAASLYHDKSDDHKEADRGSKEHDSEEEDDDEQKKLIASNTNTAGMFFRSRRGQ
tara:strand:- start:21398 stop:22393 length:996 start_codon:yes stop_codon:yes gene_type:complete